jgi:hypothetical protein
MKRLFSPILFTAVVDDFPVAAQTPPTQGWPANRPPDQRRRKPSHRGSAAAPRRKLRERRPRWPGAPASRRAPTATGALAAWFTEIDTAKKGEVSRADFVKYRMKSFEQLDANKDGKLTIDEFLKVAEPPFSRTCRVGRPRGAPQPRKGRVPEPRHQPRRLHRARRGRGRWSIRVQPVRHGPRQQGDRARVRLIVQRSMAARGRRAPAEVEPAPPPGHGAINDFIDMQLREADKLDKNNDGRIDQQEYLGADRAGRRTAGQGLLPYDFASSSCCASSRDRHQQGRHARPCRADGRAVMQFFEIDDNKDRFLNEDEFKKAQEDETKKMRAIIQAMQPAQPPQPRRRPRRAPRAPQPAPARSRRRLAPRTCRRATR